MNRRLKNGEEYRCSLNADLTVVVESQSPDGIWQSRNVKFTLAESLPSSDWVEEAMDRLKRIVVEGVARSSEHRAALVAQEEELANA